VTLHWGGSYSRVYRHTDESNHAPKDLQPAQYERLLLEIIAARSHWQTLSPPSLRGRSGVMHRFDFVATDGRASLVFDVCEQVSEIDVIKTYTKKLDTGASACIICKNKKMTARARRLTAEYSLKVLSSDKIESAFRAKGVRLQSEGRGVASA
jgi:hypothetical protein